MVNWSLCLLFLSLSLFSHASIEELFNHAEFPTVSFSPTGQYLLIHTRRTDWNASASEDKLWLYDVATGRKKFITRMTNGFIKIQWSPSGDHFAFFRADPTGRYVFVYSVALGELRPLSLGTNLPSVWKWSSNDLSMYLSIESRSLADGEEWHGVIDYRQSLDNLVSALVRLELNTDGPRWSARVHPIVTLTFLVADLLFVPSEERLIITSKSPLVENIARFEMYSIDLRQPSIVSRLTDNQAFEVQPELSSDGQHVLFRENHRRETYSEYNHTQHRLYSLDLRSGEIDRWAKDFNGHILQHMPNGKQGVLFLGQVGTEVQLYTQRSPDEPTVHRQGWSGTYHKVTMPSNGRHTMAFVFSSLTQPKEVYVVNDIDQMSAARRLTDENEWIDKQALPPVKIYRWRNNIDGDTIEGILHYPPGRSTARNLPLFVLMHGGPYAASLNAFDVDWYSWATFAALDGWLVLEPNFCGSTGYGDDFVNEIRRQTLSRPGRDVLAGVDALVREGIADPARLTIGGYSFGGLLTNWLITQTTRFNAALSGSGTVAQASAWGTMDLPLLFSHLFGGFPWVEPEVFQNQSAIYRLDRVRTPTLIVTGESDVRVHASQSYMLERSLRYAGVPVHLLVFPAEGHDLENDPWHGRIKVREELKWLNRYGRRRASDHAADE